MDAKKCDRCGKLFEYYTVDHQTGCAVLKQCVQVRNSFFYDKTTIELCRDCAENFKDWLEEEQTNATD